MKPKRFLVLSLVIVGSVGLTLLAERWSNLTRLEELERTTLDWRQIFIQEGRGFFSGEESPIVLVFFDEAATEEWPYLSPYPRAYLAELIRALDEAGARTIGLDVYLEDLYPRLNEMDRGDDRLQRAIEEAGNVVLVAPMVSTDSGRVLKEPHPAFAGPAADVGAADLPTAFETVREGVLAVRSGRTLAPSFSLSVYAESRGLDADSLLSEARRTGTLDLPSLPPRLRRLPAGWAESSSAEASLNIHTFPLRFVGPPSSGNLPKTFSAYRASEASQLISFLPEEFEDKIVLLGSGYHETDRFRTPYYAYPVPDSVARAAGQDHYTWMYGVEIHANAIQNLLDGTFVRPVGGVAEAGLLLLVASVAGLVVFWQGALWGGIAALGAALLTLVAATALYAGELSLPGVGSVMGLGPGLIWMPVVTPLVAILLSYLGSTAYVSIVEGRERRFIQGAFGKYVPPAVVDEIAQNPGALRLGGQKRSITVLFSDLAGFTSLSETMEPEELLSILNEYLTVMTQLVMDEEGTLDKYIGDAIMAFWNAPKTQEDHADRALRTAVLMQREMKELNRRWAEEGRQSDPFRVRIGVNTGDVVVGNVGGEDRFDYSAIGDPVNLSARLEPANKTYGTLVMTSEFTVEAATPDAFRLRELDLIAVKGKSRPVKVYEVLELAGAELEPSLEEALGHYESGLSAYRNRDWELAAQYFSAALEEHPDDGPSRVYLERSREYMADPPPTDWDFVVRRKVK